jgi:hypothetical protein
MSEEKTKNQEKLLCPKAGTATSSPETKTPSPKFQPCDIPNVLWWMYADCFQHDGSI